MIDTRTARFAGWVGADMVGLHAINGLPSDLQRQFKAICDQLRYENGPAAVLLTKLDDINEIVEMAQAVLPTHLQLHKRWGTAQLANLRARLNASGFASLHIIATASVADDDAQGYVKSLRSLVDLILLDHWEGGTGQPQNLSKLAQAIEWSRPTPVFIAGGLSIDNVRAKVEMATPFGVDVQTSVEVPGGHGKKDYLSVARFIRTARGMPSRPAPKVVIPPSTKIVSMSLTDIDPANIVDTLSELQDEVEIFHLDHSDETRTPGFKANLVSVAEQLYLLAPSAIYDVHVFDDPRSIEYIADCYLAVNPMLRVVFVHIDVERVDVPTKERLRALSGGLDSRGASLGIALQAPRDTTLSLLELLPHLDALGVTELSIVSPKDDGEYDNRVGRVLRAVQTWVPKRRFGLGIDRTVTHEKIRFAAPFGVTRVVIGATALHEGQMSPAQYVRAARTLLQLGTSAAA